MAFRKFATPESSNIVCVAYSTASKVLHVEFKGGKNYKYADVPPQVAGAMFTSDSVGSFFAREIKPNYQCKQIFTPCGVEPTPADEVTA